MAPVLTGYHDNGNDGDGYMKVLECFKPLFAATGFVSRDRLRMLHTASTYNTV